MSDPVVKPRTLPTRQLLVLTLFDGPKGLQFRVEWKVAAPTEKQHYDVAIALEKVARHLSKRYKDVVDRVDAASIIGFRVDELPPVIKKVLERWFSHG